MNPEKPFAEGFESTNNKGENTGESIFGEVHPLDMEDEAGTEEAEGITSGIIEIVREKLKEYFVPDKYHEEVIDLIDKMMMGELGKELQEEAGFDEQLKAAIETVEELHGISFDIEYDEEL